MSEPRLISPLLDHFAMGDPISSHDGVKCCPAMEHESDKKYIVKIISIPASQVQLDALLLTGAYKSEADANVYFRGLADLVSEEAEVLRKLSALEGFLSYEKWQIVPMSHETGYDVYLLGEYRRTLEHHFRKKPMTHLGAVNLGLDLCAAMSVCRHSGYLYVDLKPENICIIDNQSYRVSDLGFVKLSGLKYASMPDKYISQYTAPEIKDAFSSLNATVDIYAIGLILYQAYNDGVLPFKGSRAEAEVYAPPAYADYEMSEMIMKACAPDPKDRWQDPVQMGQAIVSYMQRNGANDVPIVPVPQPEEDYVEESSENPPVKDAPVSEAETFSDTEIDEQQENFFGDENENDYQPLPAVNAALPEEASSDISLTDPLSSDTDDTFADNCEDSDNAAASSEVSVPDDVTALEPEQESTTPPVDPLITEPPVAQGADFSDNQTDPQAVEAPPEFPVEEHQIYVEDEFGNLTFLDIDAAAFDETVPSGEAEDINYQEVSQEVSEILSYADELLAHPTPEPVVAPEPIDVPIPEPISVLPDESTEEIPEPDQENDTPEFSVVEYPVPEDAFPEPAEVPSIDNDDYGDVSASQGKGIKKYIIAMICMLLIAGLAFLCFYYYQHYYLQPISIAADGTENSLVVHVSSGVDESKLTVYCADTYGNSLYSSVVDGKAYFSNLAPGAGYTITVEINGFHRLTGNTSTAYSTPVQTNVVQFTGISGPEDGSVILSFAIDGPDSQQWSVVCTADGSETKRIDFTGHMVTIGGLAIGKEYTFTLESEASMYITGNSQLKWLASKNIIAENLEITSCNNNTLTAEWSAPEGLNVSSWSVRCYNDSGFDETVTTADTNVSFSGIDHSKGYTVEVTAANMTVSARSYIAANPATVTGFKTDTTDPQKIVLTWTTAQPLADGNWILLYSANGLDPHEVSCSSDNIAEITPLIPNATYTFTLLTTTGSHVFNNTYEYHTGDAPKFSNYNVTSDHMEFNMCLTPDVENWDRFDLKPADYTTTFAVGQKASFLVRVRHEYNPMSDNIVTLFVIRDRLGNIVKTATSEQTWINMWYRGYCELDIPVMPSVAGDYLITVYFNGCYAGEREFTISNP